MVESTDSHIVALPTWALGLLLAAAGLGGGGIYGFVGPSMEHEAIAQCFDNSSTALEMAAQHGAALNQLRDETRSLWEAIYARTADHHSTQDAANDRSEQINKDAQQDRMIDLLERELKR